MPNLLVEIGNTALKAAWSEGMTLGKTYRYQGEKIFDFIHSIIDKDRPDVLVISSKTDVPAKEEERLRQHCGSLLVLDRNHIQTAREYSIPEYLTPDRVASVLAVRHLFKGRRCLIFDFGTTLTVDIVDEGGEYLGGNISLGFRTRFKALSRYSKSLPLVGMPQEVSPVGDSLQSSMESGVVSGIMFEIQGYLSLFPEKIAVFTGGDALYFAKRMKNSIFAVCNLVLMGLALIADDYVGKNS